MYIWNVDLSHFIEVQFTVYRLYEALKHELALYRAVNQTAEFQTKSLFDLDSM